MLFVYVFRLFSRPVPPLYPCASYHDLMRLSVVQEYYNYTL